MSHKDELYLDVLRSNVRNAIMRFGETCNDAEDNIIVLYEVMPTQNDKPCSGSFIHSEMLAGGDVQINPLLTDCLFRHVHDNHRLAQRGEAPLTLCWGDSKMYSRHIVVSSISIIVAIIGKTRSTVEDLLNICVDGIK